MRIAKSCSTEDRSWLIDELIKLDLEYRWRQYRSGQDRVDANLTEGTRLPAFPVIEDYFTSLGTPETPPAKQLLLHEYPICRQYGDSPTAAEFADAHRILNDQTLRTLDQLAGFFRIKREVERGHDPRDPWFRAV